MRTITIKGVGRIKRKPDTIIISLIIEALNQSYDVLVEEINSKVEALSQSLERNNISRDLLKTSNLVIDTDYENEQQSNGTYKRMFKGYKAREFLTLKLPFDNLKVSMAFKAITDSKTNPEINISFTIDDSLSLSDELLELASKDAYRQAQTLARANGGKLGDLIRIEYNANNQSPREMNSVMTLRNTSSTINFNPEDVVLTDSATFEYEIVG